MPPNPDIWQLFQKYGPSLGIIFRMNENMNFQNPGKRAARRIGALIAAIALALSLAALPSCATDNSATAQTDQPASAQASGAEQATASENSAQEQANGSDEDDAEGQSRDDSSFDIAQVPEYEGEPYAVVNGNDPELDAQDSEGPAESYSDLDSLGRCGTAEAVVSEATMPTEERGSIGMVKPSGWHTVRYDDLVDGKYLYNRSHLIGYQLTGENANEENLITGTRYMNTEGMLPFENEVADYVGSTGNSVLYRATPIFVGGELVARGVHLEAMSLEDGGAGVSFNVFCYNVQPGVEIDYATGESRRDDSAAMGGSANRGDKTASASSAAKNADEASAQDYILNTNTRKLHRPDCPSVDDMSEKNKQEVTATRNKVINRGYDPCGRCRP